MKINGISLNKLKIVPEIMMIDCAAQFGPEEDNKFKNSIQEASIFKEAGLVPIYLCTNSFDQIFVTTKEKIENYLH